MDTWADDPAKVSRRQAERRILSRRSGKDRRKELAKTPKVFVRDLVSSTASGLHTLPPPTLVRDAVSIMAIHKIGLIVVVSPEKGLVGVLSERDIIRALHDQGATVLETQISEHMTRGIWTCSPDDRVSDIVATMNDHDLRHLPIVKDAAVVGVISATDLLKVRT